MVNIAWPYTNSGFALQESTNLASAAWRSSTLAPGFDSNTVMFWISAGVTNPATFFRLSLPADLRGLYVYVPLDPGPNAPAAAMVTNAIHLPGMDGMLIVGLWSSIETNLNQYDWTPLDKWMNYAAASHKRVNLAIRAGDGIPDWLYLPPTNGAGATRLTFTISPKDGQTGLCQSDLITNDLPDQNQPLLQLAGRMLPGRLVVQFNFLMTSNPAQPAVIQSAFSYGSLPAFQVNNWLAATTGAGGSACGGTVSDPTPCDDAAYLEMLQQGIYPLGVTNSLRSQYVEVWATNAVVFTNAIWQAHQELFAPP